jgi:parallel beta helix pectate lyase-like protein
MKSRIALLAAPALAAISFLGVASSAQAAPHSHRHEAMPPSVSGSAPGIQGVPLQLPAPSYTVRNQTQLLAALQSAQPGQVVQLASGAVFPDLWDMRARSGWVTVSGAGDAVEPIIEGANLEGSQNLRFTNVEFTQHVLIARNPTRGGAQPASNVQILNSDVNCGSTQTNPKTTGIVVRQASTNITIAGDWVHNCTLGLSTVAQDNPTDGLAVTHDLFQNFYGDAIDLGGLSDTTIANNVVENIHHSPGTIYHDDGIQFLGNTTNTLIQNNVLANSGDQLLFIQAAIAGQFNGVQTNSNIVVDHNLIYGAGAAAVQDQGAANLHFVDNTVWDSSNGAFIIRKGTQGTTGATTTLQGNIMQSYIQMSAPGSESHNLILSVSRPTANTLSPTDIIGVTPSFVNPSQGDFALLAGSTGSGTSSSTPTVTTSTDGVTVTGSAQNNATTLLGADPVNFPYGAPIYGVTS